MWNHNLAKVLNRALNCSPGSGFKSLPPCFLPIWRTPWASILSGTEPGEKKKRASPNPIGSMYAICLATFTRKNQANVGKYTSPMDVLGYVSKNLGQNPPSPRAYVMLWRSYVIRYRNGGILWVQQNLKVGRNDLFKSDLILPGRISFIFYPSLM